MSPRIIFTQTFTSNTTNGTGFQSPFGPSPGFAPQQPFGFGQQQQFRSPPPPAPPKPAKPCPHRILGVACDIAPTDLTREYRKLAKAAHPDVGPEAERDTRTRRMAMINVAYEEARKGSRG